MGYMNGWCVFENRVKNHLKTDNQPFFVWADDDKSCSMVWFGGPIILGTRVILKHTLTGQLSLPRLITRGSSPAELGNPRDSIPASQYRCGRLQINRNLSDLESKSKKSDCDNKFRNKYILHIIFILYSKADTSQYPIHPQNHRFMGGINPSRKGGFWFPTFSASKALSLRLRFAQTLPNIRAVSTAPTTMKTIKIAIVTTPPLTDFESPGILEDFGFANRFDC